ncbi:14291_t:CDS:2 [Acaulospora colombiana]|uniref:14291_t:CDS:1 n=1 Tax=Acaulospora colombiana TaxID=27376 RepID=A0ACA9QH56_9GLOM|nr:14291_t:CDS:2 [Acaulospora colombiana]
MCLQKTNADEDLLTPPAFRRSEETPLHNRFDILTWRYMGFESSNHPSTSSIGRKNPRSGLNPL